MRMELEMEMAMALAMGMGIGDGRWEMAMARTGGISSQSIQICLEWILSASTRRCAKFLSFRAYEIMTDEFCPSRTASVKYVSFFFNLPLSTVSAMMKNSYYFVNGMD